MKMKRSNFTEALLRAIEWTREDEARSGFTWHSAFLEGLRDVCAAVKNHERIEIVDDDGGRRS